MGVGHKGREKDWQGDVCGARAEENTKAAPEAIHKYMRVAVGSANPVKLAATEATFDAIIGATVESVVVDPGVPKQPVGHEETIQGATNRARHALDAGTYDLGVGIEGGVAEFPTPEGGGTDGHEVADGLFLVMWAAVADGTQVELGAGPAIRLPEVVTDRIRNDEELGPVMDDAFDLENVKENEGAAGVLTDGLIDRQQALETALASALGPFVTDCY